MMDLGADWSSSIVGISETCALAAIALIGYMWSMHRRREQRPDHEQVRRELMRATNIAASLQRITDGLRRDLATHHATVVGFSQRVSELCHTNEEPWHDLSAEAQAMLEPTLRFANQVSQAYDQLRQQSKELLIFADSHIDLATKLGNRRALEEQLNVMFETWDGKGPKFSVALFSIDDVDETQPDEDEEGQTVLQQVAALAEKEVRSSDFVARYGQHEIVALLPRTALAGATIFANRFRCQVEGSTPTTISGGVTEVLAGDSAKDLLARADSALYSARAEGANRLFQHNGTHIRQFDTASVSQDPTLSGGDEDPQPPEHDASEPANTEDTAGVLDCAASS